MNTINKYKAVRIRKCIERKKRSKERYRQRLKEFKCRILCGHDWVTTTTNDRPYVSQKCSVCNKKRSWVKGIS